MTAINGTGCRVVISAGKSCLSGVACLPKCQKKLTNSNIVLSHKGHGWEKCEVESDGKAKEREEKSFTCSILGYFHYGFGSPRYRMGCLAVNTASPKQGGAGVG